MAVFEGEPIAPERLRALRGDLEIALGRDVHLIDLRSASTVLRSQVLANAAVLFASGDADSEQFLDFVLSDYARLNEERGLESDLRRQDALVLNLLRACETAIDLAMHAVRKASLGVPKSSRDAFALLADGGRIAPDLAEDLQRMVGFRNVAVRRYQDVDLDVVHAIVRDELAVFAAFVRTLLQRPMP